MSDTIRVSSLGGEMRLQGGKDTLRCLKFILEARESH